MSSTGGITPTKHALSRCFLVDHLLRVHKRKEERKKTKGKKEDRGEWNLGSQHGSVKFGCAEPSVVKGHWT